MRFSVASGKGGTGKTLVATGLAWLFAEAGHPVTYVDTDVEAPNGHLFLHPEHVVERRHAVAIPALRGATCSGCGACQRACAFNAIIALKDRVLVFPELCHGCGGCQLVCQEQALAEVRREVGTVRQGRSGAIAFWSAVLDVGEAKAPPLIQGLFTAVAAGAEEGVMIVDAPPGTSCSAMTVVRNTDFVVLVTEPTPFGLHDLELAVQMCRALGKPVAAVINRADLGNQQVRQWIEGQAIPLWAEIPFSQEVAMAYADGKLAIQDCPSLRQPLDRVARAMQEMIARST